MCCAGGEKWPRCSDAPAEPRSPFQPLYRRTTMKTNQTMMLALLGAAACSFFFGLGQHEAPALPKPVQISGANAVTNCVQSCCEYTYSWYNGSAVPSAQVSGCTDPTAPNQNVSQAIASIWVQAATPGGCKLVRVGTYDQWSWTACAATCQNPPGTYQVPQIESPSGTPTLFAVGSGLNQCGS